MRYTVPYIIIVFLSIFLLGTSCRTEFEKTRTSTDPSKVLSNANQYYKDKDYSKAQILYELVIPAYRGKEEAEGIYYNYAHTYYNQEQYLLSAHYLQKYIDTYAYSENKEEVLYLIALSNYYQSPSYQLDQSSSDKAIESLQFFINSFPESENAKDAQMHIQDIRNKLELKAYEEGELYFNMKQYVSSMQSFENMLKEFPETERRENIKYLIAKSSYLWAQNSVYEKREERLLVSIDKCNSYLKKYGDKNNAKEVRGYISKSEKELNKLMNVRS